MYINNYIQIALYVPLVLVLFTLLAFSPKSKFFKSFQVAYGLLFLISLVGLIKGLVIGMDLGKDFHHIKEDLFKILTFIFFLGVPFFIIAQKKQYAERLLVLFNFFAFSYTFLVSLSLFIAGNVDEDKASSIYPGNLFGATTVNLTIISAWTFYALALYIITRKRWFMAWAMLCFLSVLGSLAKWNVLAMIAFPTLIVMMYNANNTISVTKRKKYFIVSALAMLLFFLNIITVLAPFVKIAGFESVSAFLSERIFGDPDNESNLGVAISLSKDQGIKDGARLAMWGDLLVRTGERPIGGIGLGSRALDNLGGNIEDHNIFVTHVSRYGIPLFVLWLILTINLIIKLRSYILPRQSAKMLRFIVVIIYVNFFFQASVGNIWGQMLVALLVGTSIGLLVYKSHNRHSVLSVNYF